MSTKNTKAATKSTNAKAKATPKAEAVSKGETVNPAMKLAERRKMFSSEVSNIVSAFNTLNSQYEKLGANQGKSYTYETIVDKKKTSQMINKKTLDINSKLLAQRIQSLAEIAFVSKASTRTNTKNPYITAILKLVPEFSAFLKDKTVSLGTVTIGENEYDVKRTLKSPKSGYTTKQVVSNIMVLYGTKHELYKEATSNKGNEKPNKSHVALDKTLTKHLGSYYKAMQNGNCDLDNMDLIASFYQINHHVLKEKLELDEKELAEYSSKVQALIAESPEDLEVFEKVANEVNKDSESLKIRAAVDHDILLLKLAKPKKVKAEPKPKAKKAKKDKEEEEEPEEKEAETEAEEEVDEEDVEEDAEDEEADEEDAEEEEVAPPKKKTAKA